VHYAKINKNKRRNRMKTITFTEKKLAAEYNNSAADSKVDFIAAELALVNKVTHGYSIAAPVISGNVAAYTIAATGATEVAVIAHILTDITAEDANGTDISSSLAVVITDFVAETVGTYAVTITATDVDNDTTSVAATVELTA
jgi:hypothetical protein